jgi:hypothetical protein
LVQRLFAFVMTAAETGAAVTADCIDFVDEDDARRVLLSLVEHVADARGADADEHFHEVRTGNREERHFRLAGDRACEQRLARTGRADHQDATRDLAAQALELARVFEEFDDLDDLFFRFVDTRDVSERDLHLVFAQQPRAALPERHRAAATCPALHLAHEVNPNGDQQQDREGGQEQLHQQRLALRLGRIDLDACLLERADQRRVLGFGTVDAEGLAVLARAFDDLALEDDGVDAAVFDLLQERRIRHLAFGGLAAAEIADHRRNDDGDHDPKHDVFSEIVQSLILRSSLSSRREIDQNVGER